MQRVTRLENQLERGLNEVRPRRPEQSVPAVLALVNLLKSQ